MSLPFYGRNGYPINKTAIGCCEAVDEAPPGEGEGWVPHDTKVVQAGGFVISLLRGRRVLSRLRYDVWPLKRLWYWLAVRLVV